MENEPFKITSVSKPEYMEGFRDQWKNMCFRVDLSGVALGERKWGKAWEWQYTGETFDPYELVSTGEDLLKHEQEYFQFGDRNHIPLQFNPLNGDSYEVRLSNAYEVYPRMVSFDPKIVRPAIVTKEHAAFQFYNAYNDLYWLAIKAGSEWAENELRACQEELANNQEVQELFRKRSVVFYHCEDKLREI